MTASLYRMSSYFAQNTETDDADVDVEDLAYTAEDEYDGRTPLDKTIDRIGMGSYQWTLLSLCGFGWLADNMWIQAIAIVLPRVQQHFSVRDTYIGTLSSSMFAGMMFGALGWGTCSDLMGRTTAFNATLFLTSLFGVFASFANSFVWLCIALFLLGSAVGGSMPTDGTLLLEHMPNGKQYLVTALSIFFSFGAVIAAIVGLLVIPSHSCPPAPAPCDVATQNMGWKYLLIALGIITLSMFVARIVFFRLHESPRFLVHAGRPQEALESLQLISRFNGSELSLDLQDVQDSHAPSVPRGDPPASDIRPNRDRDADASGQEESAPLIFDADADGAADSLQDGSNSQRPALSSMRSHDVLRGPPESESKNYCSTGESSTTLDSHAVAPRHHRPASFYSTINDQLGRYTPDAKDVSEVLVSEVLTEASDVPCPRPRSRARGVSAQRRSTASSLHEVKSKVYWKLPRAIRKPFFAWLDRVAMVLSREWLRTTLLVWMAWWAMSLAFTMFNVFLPKLLEGRSSSELSGFAPKSLEDSLWDVVIYALGGCPGAILGAYLIESSLGRRWSLAGSTFVTAFFCWVFVLVDHPWAVRASTVGISLSATAMWAVLYGWTPEIFGTKVRGTACGIASALSRIGGMIAPILGGTLLTINPLFPVYVSIAILLLAGICVLLLREEKGERGGERVFAH